eukprot:jgi/Mesvir1/6578/Mv04871-RA.1
MGRCAFETVACPNAEHGCDALFARKDALVHYDACGYFPCRFRLSGLGCDRVCGRGDVTKHETECPYNAHPCADLIGRVRVRLGLRDDENGEKWRFLLEGKYHEVAVNGEDVIPLDSCVAERSDRELSEFRVVDSLADEEVRTFVFTQAKGLTSGSSTGASGDTTSSGGVKALTDGNATGIVDAVETGGASIGLGLPLGTGEDSATDAVDASSERKSTETGTASSAATATNNDMDGIKTSRNAMMRKGKKLLRDFQARNERKVVGPPTPAAGNQMQLVREPEQTLVGARLPLNIPTGAPFPSPGVDPATNTIGAPSARNVANVVTPPSRDPMSDDTVGAIASQDEVVMRGHSAVDEPSTPGFDGASVTLSAKIEPVADGGHLPPDLNNVTSDDAPSGEYGIRISLDVGNALTSGSNTTSLSDDTSNLGRQARGALNDPAADVDNMTGAESTARRGDDLTRKGQRGKVQEEGISERMDGKMGAESNAIRSIDNAKSPISSSIMGIGPGDPPRKTRTRESQINRVSLWT